MNSWKSRTVFVGSVGVGGDHPIRIQSMTTSDTRDVAATVDQIIRLSDAGCEIARVTVQGIKEAEACEAIKNQLVQKGYLIPLVADIHFFPPAAMHVADFVDKVRINPGNFVDKRASFKKSVYDEVSYAKELERIEEKFAPLILKCKALKRAMRIGVNHGSLSDRIMNRYGDTPRGMLESALEFARVCRKYDYHDFLFSMKSSNPQVMIAAYRLLVEEMLTLNWDYPLHLGVTEAGAGEDGRIKSAVGIGTLLLEGIGDTIRMSLTEDPWHEIAPCRQLLSLIPRGEVAFRKAKENQRKISFPPAMGWHRDATVVMSGEGASLEALGCEKIDGAWQRTASSPDVVIAKESAFFEAMGFGVWGHGRLPVLTLEEAEEKKKEREQKALFSIFPPVREPMVLKLELTEGIDWDLLQELQPEAILLSASDLSLSARSRVLQARHFFEGIKERGWQLPVLLYFQYAGTEEEVTLKAAAEYGALICDGWGEGVWIEAPMDRDFLRRLSFNILQATRKRISKTEFISCPGCGRTLFDLQIVSQQIRARTEHLPGVKIAIMGCIVNGPGEMADADFGYVGSRSGEVDLYVGKQCIEKGVRFDQAEERLVALIKEHGRWIDP